MEARKIVSYCMLAFSIVLEYLVRTNDWWGWFDGRMDSVMHFFWGLNIFLLLVIWLRWKPASALYGVFAFQMVWELVEIVGDSVVIQTLDMMDIFWWDGIKDTIVDLLGGALGWLLLLWLPGGLKGLKESPYVRPLQRLPLYMAPGIVIGGIIWAVTGSSPQLFAVIWITLACAAAFWKN